MKPKTLGGMLAEDFDIRRWKEDEVGYQIRLWLKARGITNATPLVVEEIGTVDVREVEGDDWCVVLEPDDGGMDVDVGGRTVAVLAKPHDGTCPTCGGSKETHGHTPDGKTHWTTPCPACCPTEPVDK